MKGTRVTTGNTSTIEPSSVAGGLLLEVRSRLPRPNRSGCGRRGAQDPEVGRHRQVAWAPNIRGTDRNR